MSPQAQPSTYGLTVFFAVMYLVQSLGDPNSGMIAQPMRALLKNAEHSTGEIALFMGLIGLPWALKPLFGLIADFVPIFGSRRRTYLMITIGVGCAGCGLLWMYPPSADALWLIGALLVLMTVSIAFGDVLIDGMMVTEGQPRGLTGMFQAVQWTAAYTALLLTGVLGGYLTQIGRPELAFGTVSLLWVICLITAYRVATEPPALTDKLRVGALWRQVFSTAGIAPIAVILFVWNFNPLWTSVLYLHLTQSVGLSELGFGQFLSAFSGGALLGSATYPLYCRRIHLGTLIHLSIAAGIGGNLLYLAITPELNSGAPLVMFTIALVSGFSYMAGTMIHLDITARRAPLIAAATVFAVIMAITNLSSSVSEGFGGVVYEWTADWSNEQTAFQTLVALSGLIPALCWFFVPWLKRRLPDWFA